MNNIEFANASEKERFFSVNIYPHFGCGVSIAHAILKDYALAEDAASVALGKAWKNLEQLEHPGSAKNWYAAITRNTAIDEYRKENTHPHLSYDDGINEAAHDTERVFFYCRNSIEIKIEQSIAVMHLLEPVYAEIITLQYIEGLSPVDICRQLGISESNRRTRACRARKKMRQLME